MANVQKEPEVLGELERDAMVKKMGSRSAPRSYGRVDDLCPYSTHVLGAGPP